jgi:hypothetical protein
VKNKNPVNLVTVRAILAELDKARAAVLASDFETFQKASMRAALLMSAAKIAEDQPQPFLVSCM